jgi:mRNA interferase YafQ
VKTIEQTARFQRDFDRRIKGTPLEAELKALVMLLVSGGVPPPRHRDHPLKGEWRESRDCHLRGDMVLIYARNETTLRLVRVGTHSDLFGC